MLPRALPVNELQMHPMSYSGNVLEKVGEKIKADDYSKYDFLGQLPFPQQTV